MQSATRKSDIFVLVRGVEGLNTRAIYFSLSPVRRQYCCAYGSPRASPCADEPSGSPALGRASWPENRIIRNFRCLPWRSAGVHESADVTGVPLWVTFPYDASPPDGQPEVLTHVVRCG